MLKEFTKPEPNISLECLLSLTFSLHIELVLNLNFFFFF